MTETTKARLLDSLRSRIRDAWDHDPLYIDPIVAPGLTESQKAAVERASAETARSGIPHFIAIVPPLPTSIRSGEVWDGFTADMAFAVHEDQGVEQTLVLFAEAESAAKSYAYAVSDNGPAIPPEAASLARSTSDDFLPVELAVPYQLAVLVAAAEGSEPPPPPDFDTRDAGSRSEDYIEATGLDNDNPDALVFGATAAAALGLSVWLMKRRDRYSWRKSLTTKPDPVRTEQLPERVTKALEPLPEPAGPSEETWVLFDRGRRVQDALRALIDAHPRWAEDADFAHRYGVQNLLTTHKWIRARLRGSSKPSRDEPRFCFLFPHHRSGIERFALRQQSTTLTVDLCARCRSEINAGHDPECLMVPKHSRLQWSRPVPYFQRSDAYALSGFGSFQPLEDALLDAYGASTAAVGRVE